MSLWDLFHQVDLHSVVYIGKIVNKIHAENIRGIKIVDVFNAESLNPSIRIYLTPILKNLMMVFMHQLTAWLLYGELLDY